MGGCDSRLADETPCGFRKDTPVFLLIKTENLGEVLRRLARIERKVNFTMATLQEVVSQIGDWGVSWRDRAKAAEAAAEAANTALQTFKDQDAAEDAAQLQGQVDADTAVAQQKWDELQALDTPPSEPPTTDTPPVDEPPAEDSGDEDSV